MKAGSRKQRILRALQHAGTKGATTNELCGPDVGGERFGARLQELRDAGYRIDMEIIRQGQARYTLRGHTPADDEPAPRPVYHVVCDACGQRTQQYSRFAYTCDCGAPLHWVGVYENELAARRHTPFRRIQVQQRRRAA